MLCNLNNVDKIEPYIFDVWMGILRTVPYAKLALLSPGPPLDNSVISTLKLVSCRASDDILSSLT